LLSAQTASGWKHDCVLVHAEVGEGQWLRRATFAFALARTGALAPLRHLDEQFAGLPVADKQRG
jgi:hypothetical protein